MFSKPVLSSLALALLTLPGVGQSTGASIQYFFFSGPAMTDATLTPLVGSSTAGQGDMMQLGYFSDPSVDNIITTLTAAQWDSWVPLIGPGSINPHLVEHIDVVEGPIGFFSNGVNFDVGTAPSPGPETLPAGYGTMRMGVRFYDSNTIGTSVNYTTVTSPTWYLPGAGFPPPQPPIFDFATDPLTFQGADYVTDILLAPEPSSSLLLLLAAGLSLARRRR